ncbi:MAG TPA: hypothetical protein VM364_18035 [Vicinamibacterales bacterium]|nr:hypothetical protein [Vicinamibacterales bacterium]
MSQLRPVVHVLTDGSGSDGQPRIDSTSALLDSVGATRGRIYGGMSDREIYGAILNRDHARFLALAEELAASLVQHGADLVAGDGIEGFNPSHDVCRYIINAAVRLAAAAGLDIQTYAFPLDGAPHAQHAPFPANGLSVRLDDGLLRNKLAAAHAYSELRDEVESALQRFGPEAFRSEYLWPVDVSDPYGWDPARVPYYESYGAQRVAAGAYEHVLTFKDHVQPLADALWCHRVAAV